MAEELRLEASVVDKFSKPLRDLRNRLNDVKTPANVGRMAGDFQKIEGAVKNATRSISTGLGQAMAGLSLPSLAAAASIGGVVAAVKSFSEGTIELRQFQRETGITIGAFKTLKNAASQFGVNEDAVGPGLKRLSENLYDFRRRFGSTYAELQQIAPDFVKKLRESSPDKALEDSLDYLAQVARERGPRVAELLSEKLFGSGAFARFALRGRKAMREAFEAMRSESNPSSADERVALTFDRNVEKLRESFRKLTRQVGNEVAPAFGDVLAKISTFIEQNKGKVGGAVAEAIASITEAAKQTDWKALGSDLTTIGHALAGIAKHFDGRTGQRQAAGGAVDEIRSNLEKARQRLADYDKAHPHAAGAGLRGASNDPARRQLSGDVQFYEDRLAKATAKGVEAGMDAFIRKQSFSGAKAGGDNDAKVTQASFGGRGFGRSGDPGESPVRRQMRKHFGGSAEEGSTESGPRLRGQGRVTGGTNERAMRAMSRLIGHGWTEEAAATAVGQAMQESGVRSDGPLGDTKRFGRGDDAAHGAWQWRAERFRSLKQFAAKRGKPWTDFDTQVDFFDDEAKHGRRGTSAWSKERNLYRGNVYGRKFEGYGDNSFSTRLRNAEAALHRWRHGGAQQIPGPDKDALHEELKKPLGSARKRNWPGRDIEASLHVKIDSTGRVISSKADGGGLFHKMNVARGRSMVGASQSA